MELKDTSELTQRLVMGDVDSSTVTPEQAKQAYLDYRDLELGDYETSTATADKIEDHLTRFEEWWDTVDLTYLEQLTTQHLEGYKLWRKTDGSLATVSLNGQMTTLSVFLSWCEQFDFVKEGLAASVPIPNVSEEEEISDEWLDSSDAKRILEYLGKFEYASRAHAEFYLLWEVGIRMGAARGIDIEDCHLDEGRIELRHRPETETPLKNKEAGERDINIPPELCKVLDDYISQTDKREDVEDDHGRNPLFTTGKGRISSAHLRREMYKVTRPCIYANKCPHGNDTQECEFLEDGKESGCPSSVSPHPIRRGSIMNQLDEGIPIDDRNLAYAILSDRVDVSKPTLEKHYDPRSEEEKSRRRREALAEHMDRYGEDIDIKEDRTLDEFHASFVFLYLNYWCTKLTSWTATWSWNELTDMHYAAQNSSGQHRKQALHASAMIYLLTLVSYLGLLYL